MSGRRATGAFLALIGALAVGASAYLDWLEAHKPTEMPYDRLWNNDADALLEVTSDYWDSIAVPLVAATALGVFGAVLRSRLILVLAFLIGLATAALFLVFTGWASGDAGTDMDAGDFKVGYWVCIGGLVVLLLGLASMGRRRKAPVEDPVRTSESTPGTTPDDGLT